jgi:hypothetical protein
VDSTNDDIRRTLRVAERSVGLLEVNRLALVHISSVVLICAQSSVYAQKSADQLKADAHQAGMFQAFRVCLKQERVEGSISLEDYRRCDLAAERLYFGLYNTDYAGPNSPISKKFVDEAQKVVNDVVGHPGLCQGDADFNAVGAAVVQDIKGFYPDHPDVSCAPCVGPPGQVPGAHGGQSASHQMNWPLNKTWTKGQEPLVTDYMQAWTNVGSGPNGTLSNGIMFKLFGGNVEPSNSAVTQTCIGANGAYDPQSAHLIQFIKREICDPRIFDSQDPASCKNIVGSQYLGTVTNSAGKRCVVIRNYGDWYPDAPVYRNQYLQPEQLCVGEKCCSDAAHPPGAEACKGDMSNRARVVTDDPSVEREVFNNVSYPVKATFIDYVMCGNKQVGAITWSRQSGPDGGSYARPAVVTDTSRFPSPSSR